VNAPYWDTSCVLPLYIPEPDSAELADLAANQDSPVTSSQILSFEFLFAIHARVARRKMAKEFAVKVQRRFLADLSAGRFLLVPLGADILSIVAELSGRLAKRQSGLELRTLDGIHLATACHLGAKQVVTCDKRMRQAAEVLGLRVLPAMRRRVG
jgi:predicted nucleic acid-binding protein